MKQNLTELVFILDRSGSMSNLVNDTIGGFNSMIEKNKKEDGECIVTTILFDSEYEVLHDRINIDDIEPITTKEYYARGTTALIDSMAKAINKTKNDLENACLKERAEKVLFVIITDGHENASREFTSDTVKQLVEEQKKLGWDFIFLGANIDSFSVANNLGVSSDRVMNYHADSRGTGVVWDAMENVTAKLRKSSVLSADLDFSKEFDALEDDFENR